MKHYTYDLIYLNEWGFFRKLSSPEMYVQLSLKVKSQEYCISSIAQQFENEKYRKKVPPCESIQSLFSQALAETLMNLLTQGEENENMDAKEMRRFKLPTLGRTGKRVFAAKESGGGGSGGDYRRMRAAAVLGFRRA